MTCMRLTAPIVTFLTLLLGQDAVAGSSPTNESKTSWLWCRFELAPYSGENPFFVFNSWLVVRDQRVYEYDSKEKVLDPLEVRYGDDREGTVIRFKYPYMNHIYFMSIDRRTLELSSESRYRVEPWDPDHALVGRCQKTDPKPVQENQL